MSEETNTNGPDEIVEKTLKCKDCGEEFIWTVGEQKFFKDKGFKNKPARCKNCRQINRKKVDAEFFKIKCSGCDQIGEVLFQPKDPTAEIFCRSCFEKRVLKNSPE